MTTLFELVGGSKWFADLVEHFYAGVASDPLLRPLYPEEDLAGAKERLTGFLVQYWGGPATYSEQRGHPRLRLRHVPYRIGVAEQEAWLHHMTTALRGENDLSDDVLKQVFEYFEGASIAMINVSENS